MERLHAKIIAGVVMFIAILVCFLLPIKLTGFFLRRGNRGQYYLDLLACFAGGVFLAAYLIFMAPSVRELLVESLMRPNGIEYPLPDMLIGLGFFVLLIINRIVITMSKIPKYLMHNEKCDVPCMEPSIEPVTNGTHLVRDVCANYVVMPISPSNASGETIVNGLDEQQDADSPFPLPRRSSISSVAHQDSTLRSVVMMLALSLDSVLEGFTTGFKTTTIEVWGIFIGNLVHETVIAFCLGLQLIRVQKSIKPIVIAAIAYSLMNPIGLAVGALIFETVESGPHLDLVNGIVQALTSGCFIYVTFCEILEGQITHKTSFAKIGAMFAGYAVLAAFAAIPGSSAYSFLAVRDGEVPVVCNMTHQ